MLRPPDPAPRVDPGVEVISTPAPPRAAPPKSNRPAPVTHTGHRVTGVPTYYCRAGVSICTHGYPDRAGVKDFYAAAGPSMRVGKWRGRVVTVTANGKSIRVKLIDWCACGSGGHFLDLYWDAFHALGSPMKAVVTW